MRETKQRRLGGEKMINIYLPSNSLQGAEIPFYMLWSRSEIFDLIRIEYPTEMEIKEIYNVSEGNFRLENNILHVNKVDVNGYLGIKFISKLTDPNVEKNLHIEVYKEDKVIHSENKPLKLFRPDIKLYNLPHYISIDVRENQINISNKIKIVNNGLGTAILRLECLDSSDIKTYDPMDIEEFRKNFWSDVERKTRKLNEKFPEYSQLLIEFVEIGKNPPLFKKSDLDRIKKLFSELVKALDENEEFLKDFGNMIVTSYLKNISIVTELESFLIYLKSIYENKIILIDAINVMKISTAPMKLKSKLYITDFAYNEYKPIELDNITIVSNKEVELPVYLLFDFSIPEKGVSENGH